MQKNILIVYLVVFSANAWSQQLKNPIISGFYPDPSICRVKDEYYIVNSSFAYFPGIPISKSKDLVNWSLVGYCLTRPSQLDLSNADISGGIWASTIRHYQDTFYVVSTNTSGKGHFIVKAKDPAGFWSEPIWVENNGIDPSLMFDDDGKVYFTRNGTDQQGEKGIVQYQIDINTGKPLSPIKKVANGNFDEDAEGPHLYKIGSYYYLLLAEGGTHVGHMVTIQRSKNPNGPFETCPRNPILTHRNKLFEQIQATGHGDLFQDHRGNWWLVFLGIRNYWGLPVKHNLGRETFLAPVSWEDDWPLVNEGKAINTLSNVNQLWNKDTSHTWYAWEDRFDSKTVKPEWNFLRNPDTSKYVLEPNKGILSILPEHSNLDAKKGSVSFIGRRQQHHWSSFKSSFSYSPPNNKSEAGITIYMGPNFHIDAFITLRKGKKNLVIRRVIDDIRIEEVFYPVQADKITLEVKSNPWAYEIYVYSPKNEPQKLFHAQSRLLTSEVAGGFVGVYYALYATNTEGSKNPPLVVDEVFYKELKP